MMFRKTLRIGISAALASSLISCGGHDTEAPSRSVIDGVWDTVCIVNEDQSSQRIRYSFFENNTLSSEESFYSDSACAQLSGRLVHKGDYLLAVRNEVNLYEVDLMLNEVAAKPVTPEGAAAWNAKHFCGLTRWVSGVDENVISQSDPSCGVFGVSRIEYRDLVLVDNDRSLTFGAPINHLVPRPSRVDSSDPRRVFNFVSH